MSLSSGGGTVDSGDGSSGINFGDHPFTWVLVPLCVLIVAAVVVTFLRVRRRQQQRRSRGTAALERDLEAAGSNRPRRTAGTRWQWASDGPRSGRVVGLGLSSREEGLNELGEAPPAYSPPPKSSQEIEMVASLSHLHPTASLPPATQHSSYGTQATPPAYGETSPSQSLSPEAGHSAEPHQPALPAPAVLPSR